MFRADLVICAIGECMGHLSAAASRTIVAAGKGKAVIALVIEHGHETPLISPTRRKDELNVYERLSLESFHFAGRRGNRKNAIIHPIDKSGIYQTFPASTTWCHLQPEPPPAGVLLPVKYARFGSKLAQWA
jgi:hypothetical protein